MPRRAALHLVAFLSGLAGLGYELVWTRMLALGLGHELPAALAVLTAFFLGLALGGWLSERRRLAAAPPAALYAALEGVIGAWALATAALIPGVNSAVGAWIGPAPSALHHWAVALLVPFVLLLPATCAMGATLPCLARLVAGAGAAPAGGARIASALYAVNTGGAVAGTLLSAFVLVPRLGYGATLASLAAVNLGCVALALLAARGGAGAPGSAPRRAAPGGPRLRALSALLLLTGLLGVGYEVLVVRLLSQVQEGTVYGFAGALAVYLVASAAGAALYHRHGLRLGPEPLPLLLTATATACLAGALTMTRAPALAELLRRALGAGAGGAIAAELSLAAAALLLPAASMGATFAHLADAARARPLGLGGGLALNTLAGAAAPLVFGVGLVPAAGLRASLLLCALGYLPLGRLATGRWRAHALLPAGVGAAWLLLCGPLRLVTLAPGEALVEHVEGVMAAVSVVQDAHGDVHLKVNNHFQMGGTSSAFSDLRQGHLPLLLHPAPRSALYLGLGTAVTFSAAADHPGLEAQGVELVPEVVDVVPRFRAATGDLSAAPGLSLVVADARRFVTSSARRWDVIVADLFHPARDGAGSLYTREHFLAVRDRLEEGGLFCQWLPLYQLDLETFRAIVRTFLDAFPDGAAYLAHFSLRQPIVGLVGRRGPSPLRPGWFAGRVRDARLAARLRGLRLRDDYGLLGGYLAGPQALRAFAGPGPRNTDDFPLVVFQAPRFTYGAGEPAQARLLALVAALHARPEELLGPARGAEDRDEEARLGAYWAARDDYLRAGAAVRETADPDALLAQVQEPLLAAVRRSRDFDPAYEPLLALAARLRTTAPARAEALLLALERANPWRAEAGALRQGAAPGSPPP